eukprot:TRINITY_DN7494_c0_g1_i2.p1 TRINITY_DN7494_c0_g1~~TRINITY_DN7494_c0_g1_i2.p1  ORF type:complete len:204 (+),score=31.22 TRINITY_DN7494_c0_g1_i2:128-739(+)
MATNSKSKFEWTVALKDGTHKVIFEHGTISGKRVIQVDGEEIFRKNWMFKLVGTEDFVIGKGSDKHRAVISITPTGMNYVYQLKVDGKDHDRFSEETNKSTLLWPIKLNGNNHAVAIDVETMEIFVDGTKVEAEGEFVEDGTETHFQVANAPALIHTSSTGEKTSKITHVLYVNEEEVLVPEDSHSRRTNVGWKGDAGGANKA